MKLGCLGLSLAIALAGCQQDKTGTAGGPGPSAGGTGQERGECRPDKTCDANLLCLSNLCVRPPAADCGPIAEDLTSMDLGNYAEPETREPVVAKYKAQCEQAMITKEEGACLDKTRDKWAAAQCAPRLFPELASSGDTGQCAAIAQKVAAGMQKQVNYGNNPQMKSWFDITIRVFQESCEQDKWPDTLKRCALASDMSQNPMGMTGCEKEIPPGATQKMQQRLSQAMQVWQQQQQRGG
jgi:hypothetical protein